jgi:hypothetical protein
MGTPTSVISGAFLLQIIQATFLRLSQETNISSQTIQIRIPLHVYDGTEVPLFVSSEAGHLTLHDECRIANYLQSNEISLRSLCDANGKYRDFMNRVTTRYDVHLNRREWRFYTPIQDPANPEKTGEKVFRFAQGLIMVSHLVMFNGVGMGESIVSAYRA